MAPSNEKGEHTTDREIYAFARKLVSHTLLIRSLPPSWTSHDTSLVRGMLKDMLYSILFSPSVTGEPCHPPRQREALRIYAILFSPSVTGKP
jgi:hypothetical protein